MSFTDAHFHSLGSEERLPESLVAGGCCGTHPGDWDAVVADAERDSRIVPFIGLHPWWIETAKEGWEDALRSAFERHLGVGVGEIGLDRTSRSPSLDVQVEVLLIQLVLAQEYRRPAVVHCVRAWGRLVEVLDEAYPPDAPLMLHGFSGSVEMMERLSKRSGTVFSCGVGAKPAVLQEIPLEKLVFESDSSLGSNRKITDAESAIRLAAETLGEPFSMVSKRAGAVFRRFVDQM